MSCCYYVTQLGIRADINKGTVQLCNKQADTVSCTLGEFGSIYDGILKFEIEQIGLSQLEKQMTQKF